MEIGNPLNPAMIAPSVGKEGKADVDVVPPPPLTRGRSFAKEVPLGAKILPKKRDVTFLVPPDRQSRLRLASQAEDQSLIAFDEKLLQLLLEMEDDFFVDINMRVMAENVVLFNVPLPKVWSHVYALTHA